MTLLAIETRAGIQTGARSGTAALSCHSLKVFVCLLSFIWRSP
jgi:hypothetical protein